jgi:hypothetical protein
VADLADQLDPKTLKRVEGKTPPSSCHLLDDKNAEYIIYKDTANMRLSSNG